MSRQQTSTQAIVLARVDYGEADRILTMLTPDYGKLRLMARGVRRIKSKLAGGVELFSVSDITFVQGRGEIGTLASSRLNMHYGNIAHHLERAMLGYEFIKLIQKNTEDQPESEYFVLLRNSLDGLNTESIPLPLLRLWFILQLLNLAGHGPNLQTDSAGKTFQADSKYIINLDEMSFTPAENGRFTSKHIKLLRLASQSSPQLLAQVQGGAELAQDLLPTLDTMLRTHLKV